MKRILFVLLAVLMIVSAQAAKTIEERVDSLMQTRYNVNEPGAAVMIMMGDSVLIERYGKIKGFEEIKKHPEILRLGLD